MLRFLLWGFAVSFCISCESSIILLTTLSGKSLYSVKIFCRSLISFIRRISEEFIDSFYKISQSTNFLIWWGKWLPVYVNTCRSCFPISKCFLLCYHHFFQGFGREKDANRRMRIAQIYFCVLLFFLLKAAVSDVSS